VYTIIGDGLRGFGVEVASPGRFLSVRGFATQVLAEAWIAEQKLAQAAVDAAAKVVVGRRR
jgi:hypothetical protein